MQFLLSVMFGMICAWALKRKNASDGFCRWRLGAGALGAAFPHSDVFLKFFGRDVYEAYSYGITWSLFLAPLYAFILAYVLGYFSKRTWQTFYPITAGALILSILLSMLTYSELKPLSPILNWHVSIGLFYPLDLALLFFCGVTLLLGYFFRGVHRDIGRLGLIVIFCYVGASITFYKKVEGFAEDYAEAFHLKVEKIHVMPQPISPMNWRVIVETKGARLHDTFVNISRKEEKVVDDTATRAARIDALYKPTDKAVWRIYRRYGRHKSDVRLAKSAWMSMQKSGDQFARMARFAIFQSAYNYNDYNCAKFLDLRLQGSRREKEGSFLICNESGQAVLYRSDQEGTFSRLDMMY